MLRVAFILPFFDEKKNSFSKIVEPAIVALQEAGADIVVISANHRYIGKYSQIHTAVRIWSIPFPFLSFVESLLKLSWMAWKLDCEQPFDIIHNHGCGTSIFQNIITAHASHHAWLSAKKKSGRGWSTWVNPLHALVILVEKFNYRYSNCPVIAVSNSLAEQLLQYHPHLKGRLKVVENGIPFPKGVNTKSRRAPRDSEQTYRITFASNHHRKKGLFELLATMKIAVKDGRNWQLLVLGFDPAQAIWERRIAADPFLNKRVMFLGHVNNVVERIAESDVFCLPTPYESFGIVYLEAAAARVPIIGTTGIYPDLIGPAYKGLELPLSLPVAPNALYKALKRVEELSRTSWLKVATEETFQLSLHFSEERMIRETLSIYGSITRR